MQIKKWWVGRNSSSSVLVQESTKRSVEIGNNTTLYAV